MTPPRFLALVDEYVTVRRGLGFGLDTPYWLLRSFARFADQTGHHRPLTTDLAVQWARASQSRNPAQATRRLSALRPFARYCALFDAATEIPPPGLLGRLPKYLQPEEVERVLQRCDRQTGGVGAITPFCCSSRVSGCGPARSSR